MIEKKAASQEWVVRSIILNRDIFRIIFQNIAIPASITGFIFKKMFNL